MESEGLFYPINFISFKCLSLKRGKMRKMNMIEVMTGWASKNIGTRVFREKIDQLLQMKFANNRGWESSIATRTRKNKNEIHTHTRSLSNGDEGKKLIHLRVLSKILKCRRAGGNLC